MISLTVRCVDRAGAMAGMKVSFYLRGDVKLPPGDPWWLDEAAGKRRTFEFPTNVPTHVLPSPHPCYVTIRGYVHVDVAEGTLVSALEDQAPWLDSWDLPSLTRDTEFLHHLTTARTTLHRTNQYQRVLVRYKNHAQGRIDVHYWTQDGGGPTVVSDTGRVEFTLPSTTVVSRLVVNGVVHPIPGTPVELEVDPPDAAPHDG